jgi:hydroxymethylglutaryl-CoA synthase
MKVGIEALGIAVPPTYVAMEELAKARNVEPSKYLEGIGTSQMAVALPDEDTVTLAARAAKMALESAGVSPQEIALLVVGTETAVDHSKPVASYVQSLVGVGKHCRVFETKHACYGGTAALQLALDWIRSGSAAGKKALIICSDIARYGIGTAGEPTQGAGAVAMLISDDPKLLSLEPDKTGVYSNDVHDFWRPLYSKDAFVDGQYSVQCYLDALSGAYQQFREKNGGVTTADFAALAYHVPYGKMAKKAHRQVRTLEGDATPDATFNELVGSSLTLCAKVGNIYTGSLYLSLTSMLATNPKNLDGQRIGLFSYGSGSCAEFFAGTVTPGAQARVKSLGLEALLANRRKLSISEYEAIMGEREQIDQRPLTVQPADDFRFLGVDAHRRTYVAPSRTALRE